MTNPLLPTVSWTSRPVTLTSERPTTSRPAAGATERDPLAGRREARPGRWRDRHGRGVRGPLAPPELPIMQTRAARFDDLVLDAVDELEPRWSRELASIEFAVEDVPPDGAEDALDPVPLGRVDGLRDGRSRAVVYRRPVEARAPAGRDRRDLVHDVVVELVADALGIDPERLDPDYGSGGPGGPTGPDGPDGRRR